MKEYGWIIGVFLLLVFFLVFPLVKDVLTKPNFKEEAFQKGTPVEVLIVDKHVEESNIRIGLYGTTTKSYNYTLKVKNHKKVSDLSVNKQLYENVKIGEKIKGVEYKEQLILEK